MQFHRKAAPIVTHEPGTLGKALERRQGAEAALHGSEQQFRRLANAMPQIVWISDPTGRTEYLNDYWYEFSGIERGSAGCESWLAAVHPDDEQVCRGAWHAAIQSGLP